MRSSFSLRVTLLVIALGILLTFILWGGFETKRRIDFISEQYNKKEVQSFQISNGLQHRILQIQRKLLLKEKLPLSSNWESLIKESQEALTWIDNHYDLLHTTKEQEVMNEVQYEFSLFLQMMKDAENVKSRQQQDDIIDRLQLKGEQIVLIGHALSQAHSEAFRESLSKTDESLQSLVNIFYGCLFLVGLLVILVFYFAYRDLIAPLRRQIISSQIQIESQQKLASLGSLSTEIAHEIRNPLTAMRAYLYTLDKEAKTLSASESFLKKIKNIFDEISRLEKIVQDFLTFTKPEDTPHIQASLHSILQSIEQLFSAEFSNSPIKFVYQWDSDVEISCDPNQLKQVLINLIRNAAESIEGEGQITFETRNQDNKNVQISISDNGKGISPDILQKVFEPFFTTKAQGTGLGLAIASKIIKSHGGQLSYKTAVNKGTVFSIILPYIKLL